MQSPSRHCRSGPGPPSAHAPTPSSQLGCTMSSSDGNSTELREARTARTNRPVLKPRSKVVQQVEGGTISTTKLLAQNGSWHRRHGEAATCVTPHRPRPPSRNRSFISPPRVLLTGGQTVRARSNTACNLGRAVRPPGANTGDASKGIGRTMRIRSGGRLRNAQREHENRLIKEHSKNESRTQSRHPICR